MIQEVLFALAGHPGDLVLETDDCFALSSHANFLSGAERQLIEQVVRAGFHCRRLSAFAEAVRRQHLDIGSARDVDKDDAPRAGHYMYGATSRIEAVLDSYRGRVVELETQVLQEPSLPLVHIAAEVEDDRRTLLVLHRLVEKVQTEHLEGGLLLNLLWSSAACHMGPGSIASALWSLVSGAGQVLANQLVAWLIYGRLVDPHGEFFVKRSKDQQPSWCSGSAWYGNPVDDFSKEVDASVAQQEWQNMFFLSVEAVPCNIMSIKSARKVLFVGKAVRVLLRGGRWLPVARASVDGHGDDGVEPSLEPLDVQQEISALRRCFDAKSPAYVIEQSVERIRVSAALQLRQLVVVEADLAQHLSALKGFYLLGYGAFYQTLLEESSPLFQKPPSAYAEIELQHGPWATAIAEHEIATESATTARLESLPLERFLAPRFAVRFVPRQFDYSSFADAARQVKLVGMARLVEGHAELSIGQISTSGSSAVGIATRSVAMMWLLTRQRVAHGFDHSFTFQIHAPPYGRSGIPAEYGCRFALCFQNRLSPSALHRWKTSLAGDMLERDSHPSPQKCPIWTNLSECLALEITYCVLPPPPGGDASTAPLAEITFAIYVCHQALSDGKRTSVPSGNALAGAAPVKLLALEKLAVPAPRGALHLVRLMHDARERRLRVFFGTDAVEPICSADFDIGATLSLDLGCAYVGFCLVPLDHQHHIIGGRHATGTRPRAESRYSSRDRPLSIVSWRHRTHEATSHTATGVSALVDGRPSDPLGAEAWFGSIELSYDVPWPLPLVITQACIGQYNQLFKLLFAFRYALMELHRVDIPRGERFPWLLRAQLSFFVSQVLCYLQQDVIEVAHQELLHMVDASQDFDEVVGAHEEFLSVLTTNCFLNSPDLHGILLKALRTTSSFCRLRFPGIGASTRPSDARAVAAAASARTAELRRLQTEFVKSVESLLRMMTMMHREGVHTQISQLLLRLDYNGFFSGDLVGDGNR